jgi:rod shape-determining protein MreD
VRWLLLAILGYACLVAQTAVFRPGGLAIPIDGLWSHPDLVIILGLFVALHIDTGDTFIVGWCLGMACDLVSVSGRLGLYALLLSILLTALSAVRRRVRRNRATVQAGLCFAAVFISHLLWLLVAAVQQDAPLGVLRAAEGSLFDAVYSAFMAPYLFWLLARLRGPLGMAADAIED